MLRSDQICENILFTTHGVGGLKKIDSGPKDHCKLSLTKLSLVTTWEQQSCDGHTLEDSQIAGWQHTVGDDEWSWKTFLIKNGSIIYDIESFCQQCVSE